MSDPYGDKIFEKLINIVPHVPGEGQKAEQTRANWKRLHEKKGLRHLLLVKEGSSARGSARGGGKKAAPPKKQKPKGN